MLSSIVGENSRTNYVEEPSTAPSGGLFGMFNDQSSSQQSYSPEPSQGMFNMFDSAPDSEPQRDEEEIPPETGVFNMFDSPPRTNSSDVQVHEEPSYQKLHLDEDDDGGEDDDEFSFDLETY